MLNTAFWRGRRVFVTGHTGFKGGWLTLWLHALGAEVTALALPPETQPNLFSIAKIAGLCDSYFGDIRDLSTLTTLMVKARPEVVLHLAAQPLVRRSYREPTETFATNVMGTANLLEAVRLTGDVRVCQIITTDKCYENLEWAHPYRETDTLGGHDPYSASKACAELVASSYRRSFFGDGATSIATARAGNVIGGGDWSEDRLIPDCIRALVRDEEIVLRRPYAVRPWQHVLEPLAGYLMLAEKQWECPADYSEAFNFGPDTSDTRTVSSIVDATVKHWGHGSWSLAEGAHLQPHEAGLLRLDNSKAKAMLAWLPQYDADTAIAQTVAWYRALHENSSIDAAALCRAQIDQFVRSAT